MIPTLIIPPNVEAIDPATLLLNLIFFFQCKKQFEQFFFFFEIFKFKSFEIAVIKPTISELDEPSPDWVGSVENSLFVFDFLH